MRRNERCADSRPSRPHPAGLVGTRGVLNDAISMYFSDANRRAPLLRVGVRRGRVETTGGVFRVPVAQDEPERRVGRGPDAAKAVLVHLG
jgi:hypothetical protein